MIDDLIYNYKKYRGMAALSLFMLVCMGLFFMSKLPATVSQGDEIPTRTSPFKKNRERRSLAVTEIKQASRKCDFDVYDSFISPINSMIETMYRQIGNSFPTREETEIIEMLMILRNDISILYQENLDKKRLDYEY